MMVTLSINGQEYEAESGITLLQLARQNGIEIPTFCDHQALIPFGACRICVVEIRKGERVIIDASCTYPAEEGISVFTDTPAVTQVRKMVLEFLLARCPGVEKIQSYAAAMGVDEKRMPVKDTEKEDCILCGRCVRVCREVIGKSAISFTYRGAERKVATPFHSHSKDCIGCTACVFVCPTGAIKVKRMDSNLSLTPWNTEVSLVPCSSCGGFFSSHKTLEHVRERFELPEGWERTCPECRRKEMAGVVTGIKYKGKTMNTNVIIRNSELEKS
jgi:bidirectional [NiFe] hydrogenase diaphorase subunit